MVGLAFKKKGGFLQSAADAKPAGPGRSRQFQVSEDHPVAGLVTQLTAAGQLGAILAQSQQQVGFVGADFAPDKAVIATGYLTIRSGEKINDGESGRGQNQRRKSPTNGAFRIAFALDGVTDQTAHSGEFALGRTFVLCRRKGARQNEGDQNES